MWFPLTYFALLLWLIFVLVSSENLWVTFILRFIAFTWGFVEGTASAAGSQWLYFSPTSASVPTLVTYPYSVDPLAPLITGILWFGSVGIFILTVQSMRTWNRVRKVQVKPNERK